MLECGMAIECENFDWKRGGCLDFLVSKMTFGNLGVETKLLTEEEIRLERKKLTPVSRGMLMGSYGMVREMIEGIDFRLVRTPKIKPR